MGRVERLLHILALLRIRGNLRAIDLARRCGVSKRTILRDISTISGASIPITFDSGYRLLHEGFLPPLCFTSDERAFLSKLLKSYGESQADGGQRILGSIIDKLETSMTSDRSVGTGDQGNNKPREDGRMDVMPCARDKL